MRIKDLLHIESIELGCKMSSKSETLDKAVSLMVKSGNVSNEAEYRNTVYKREEEGTTGIGEGIAIPHGKCAAVKSPGLAAMVIPEGVDFDSLDGEKVNLLFLIAAPNTEDNVHLDVLSKLSMMLMNEDFTKKLKAAATPEEFLSIIDEAESDRDEKQEAKEKNDEDVAENQSRKVKILAVTGCPTGIAHTYMAAESLEKAAAKLGYDIKVETRGSGGAKNIVAEKEIQEADGIIIAADTKVPIERFNGKKVIFCKVSDGISKAEELLEKIAKGDAKVYKATSNSKAEESTSEGEKFGWHTIYKHLMNGVSHMLPFVVGGGILIALAFLIDGLSVDISAIQDKSTFGTITAPARFLKTVGGYAFQFMLPVLAGYIAMSIGDRPALALGIVGGYMASIGKSGFLGALVIGFAAGYIIEGLKKLCSFLPEKLDGIKPVLIYPLVGVLLVGLLMTFVIEPPVGALNQALNNALKGMGGTSKVILGLILGGMMAVDLGGPVNKASYVFGVASIASGNYDIMAAVMIGGMVPPCAIALATLLFKNKFTKEERKSGPVNFIMGLSFISEGAIPYAAADPLRIIPSCVVGSAIAGALSMFFGCELMAPHGGIFVFPVVEKPLMYVVALVVGTIVSTILLGLLKKKKTN